MERNIIDRFISHISCIQEFNILTKKFLTTNLNPNFIHKNIDDIIRDKKIKILSIDNVEIITEYNPKKSIIDIECTKYDEDDNDYTYIVRLNVTYYYDLIINNGKNKIFFLSLFRNVGNEGVKNLQTFDSVVFKTSLSFAINNIPNHIYMHYNSKHGKINIKDYVSFFSDFTIDSKILLYSGYTCYHLNLYEYTGRSDSIDISSSFFSYSDKEIRRIYKSFFKKFKQSELEDDVYVYPITVLNENNVSFSIDIIDECENIIKTVDFNTFIEDVVDKTIEINNEVYNKNEKLDVRNDPPDGYCDGEKLYYYTGDSFPSITYYKEDYYAILNAFTIDLDKADLGISSKNCYNRIENKYKMLEKKIKNFDMSKKYVMKFEDYARLINDYSIMISLKVDLIDAKEYPSSRIRKKIRINNLIDEFEPIF